jgi:hypothetical protein
MVVDFSESSHELNSWTLIDLQGKSVLEGVFSSVIQKIDVSSVESGSYVLRASGKEALGEMPLVIQ